MATHPAAGLSALPCVPYSKQACYDVGLESASAGCSGSEEAAFTCFPLGEQGGSPLSCNENLLDHCHGTSPLARNASVEAPRPALAVAQEQAQLIQGLRHQQEREQRLAPTYGYIETRHGTKQCGTESQTPGMRLIVTSWMVEVAAAVQLQDETLHLAVQLFDRLLSSLQGIPRGLLQMVAVSCVMVAAKQLEVCHPLVEELVSLGAGSFTAADLLRMERILLDALDFHVTAPTAHTFLSLLHSAMPALAPGVLRTAAFLTDIALLDYSMLQFTPSATAASALTLAMQLHSPAPRPAVHDAAIHYEAGSCDDAADMEQLLGYSPAQLAPCVRALHQLHWAAVRPATPADRDLVTPVCTRYTQLPVPSNELPF